MRSAIFTRRSRMFTHCPLRCVLIGFVFWAYRAPVPESTNIATTAIIRFIGHPYPDVIFNVPVCYQTGPPISKDFAQRGCLSSKRKNGGEVIRENPIEPGRVDALSGFGYDGLGAVSSAVRASRLHREGPRFKPV